MPQVNFSAPRPMIKRLKATKGSKALSAHVLAQVETGLRINHPEPVKKSK